MGEQAAVNPKASAVNAKSTTRPLRLGIDVPMLITVAFLLGFGILMVYSASWQPSMLRGESPSYYLVNQLKWAVVGIAGGTFLSTWITPLAQLGRSAHAAHLACYSWCSSSVRCATTQAYPVAVRFSLELAKVVIIIYWAYG